ncbi:UNVERIFIED_CONTAM: ABC transporter G family member 11 [Sesamum indicum]
MDSSHSHSQEIISKEKFESCGSVLDPVRAGLAPVDVNLSQDVLQRSGVYLTWEELWVTVSTGKRDGAKSILRGLTGYACPGEVLAIMGPSGCGKSTLLDALAGRLSSRTRQKGEILINGQKQKLAYGTSFFAVNGYACPPLQNPADHCLKMINTDFDEDIEQGTGSKFTVEEVIDLLIASYNSSDTCKKMKTLVAEIHKREGGPTEKKASQANLLTQCLILTKRSFVNMYRDLGYYWLRLAIYVALGFGLGSVFYNVGSSYNSIHERGSLLMFIASLLTIMAIGGFPSFVEDLKVFRRERLNGHYGAAAFVVAHTVSSTPFLLLISAIPGAITYFLSGLHPGNIEFMYFTLVLLACMMLVESLMMIVATIMPNFLLGLIVGAGIQGLMMLSGGFFQLPKDLPTLFWKYPMYYVAFHKYAYQGLYKNEFEGRRFRNDQLGGPSTIEGETILRDIWQVEMGYSKWTDLAVLFGMVVVYRVLFFVTVKIDEKMNSVLAKIVKNISAFH